MNMLMEYVINPYDGLFCISDLTPIINKKNSSSSMVSNSLSSSENEKHLHQIKQRTTNELTEALLTDKGKQLLTSCFGNYNSIDIGSDDETTNNTVPRVKRCSSLKTGKTPPGTPGPKKIVRFADALGLDLAAVRTFPDELPKVPKSAFKDLNYNIEPLQSFSPTSGQTRRKSATIIKTLVPTFHQPASRPDFFDRVRDNKVSLENAYFSDNFTIKGTVRVMNMDFHKSVYIRYTYDEWKTFTDFQATYVNGSCDGFSDRFEFTLYLRSDLIELGSRIILAIRFHCKGEQFWDNNYGSNYLFHCVPGASSDSQLEQSSSSHDYSSSTSLYNSSPDDPWMGHMWL